MEFADMKQYTQGWCEMPLAIDRGMPNKQCREEQSKQSVHFRHRPLREQGEHHGEQKSNWWGGVLKMER